MQRLRRGRALGNFRGVSAMEAVYTGGPLRGWMPQQRGAILFQIRRQLHPQWVLNLGVTLLKRGDDAGGISDGTAVEPQNGQLALARRAPDADQVVGAKHAAPVRDALVVERPTHFFRCSARAGCATAA